MLRQFGKDHLQKKKLLGLIILFFLLGPGREKISAVNMQSDSYRIQWGNINIGGGKPTSTNYNLNLTIGQTAPGDYQSTGYWLRAGFQYIHSIIPFSFSISDLSIDFGSLSPQTLTTATNTLTVSAGGAGGYQVLAFENHPLRSQTGAEIPDTTCDNNNCSETTAAVWQQTTTYGFGFNISGDDIPADFVDSTYFRQFANQEEGESAQEIMGSTSITRSSQATVTYQVNISSLQEAGTYSNAIVFIAVPRY